MTITVVGAGVAGLVVATELADRGLDVEVIDREPSLGSHACSWHAGGMLAPWCESETAEEPVLRLGLEAIAWWEKHVPGVVRRGTLVVTPSRDRQELDRFDRRTGGHVRIDGNELAALEPDLAGRFPAALHFSEEAHMNPRLALAALVEQLIERGVPARFDTSLESCHGKNGTLVDARGFAARSQLKDLRGVRGEMLLVRCRDVDISRPVRLIHPRFPAYVVPHGDGLFMIGATQLESESRAGITARGAVDLLSAAYALHPAFGEAEILETGADVRPAFPDNLPRIRRHGQIVHVNGLYRHGFLLAPACARMLAETLLDPTIKPEIMDEDHCERKSA
jgi:glycine oxidase